MKKTVFITGAASGIGRASARLFAQRGHQLGMAMAEGVDRNACAEIEISLAVLGEEIRSFAPDERNLRPIVGWQQRRKHGGPPLPVVRFRAGKGRFIDGRVQRVKQGCPAVAARYSGLSPQRAHGRAGKRPQRPAATQLFGPQVNSCARDAFKPGRREE